MSFHFCSCKNQRKLMNVVTPLLFNCKNVQASPLFSCRRGFRISKFLQGRIKQQLDDLMWLEEQSEELEKLRKEANVLSGKFRDSQELKDMMNEIESLESNILKQKALRARLQKELAQDDSNMLKWIERGSISSVPAQKLFSLLKEKNYEMSEIHQIPSEMFSSLPLSSADREKLLAMVEAERTKITGKQKSVDGDDNTPFFKKLLYFTIFFMALLLVIYKLCTQDLSKAAYELSQRRKPVNLPETYVPRKELDDAIRQIFNGESDTTFAVVCGAPGTGKTSAVNFASRRARGILYVTVDSSSTESALWVRLAETLQPTSNHKWNAIDAESFVRNAFKLASWFSKTSHTVVLDLIISPSNAEDFSAGKAQQEKKDDNILTFAKKLALKTSNDSKKTSNFCGGDTTPTIEVKDLINFSSASNFGHDSHTAVFTVGDLTKNDARELLASSNILQNELNVEQMQLQVGLRAKDVLKVVSGASFDEILQTARADIETFIKSSSSPSSSAAISALLKGDYENGVPIDSLHTMPPTSVACLTSDCKNARFVSKAHYRAASNMSINNELKRGPQCRRRRFYFF